MTGHKPNILVVDDEFVIAMETELLLRDTGYHVLGPAANLDEAWSLLSRSRVDAAVLDINVTGASVLPLAAELDARQIPYVFHTGYDTVMRSGRRERAARVVCKPTNPNELLDKLHGQLRQRLRKPQA